MECHEKQWMEINFPHKLYFHSAAGISWQIQVIQGWDASLFYTWVQSNFILIFSIPKNKSKETKDMMFSVLFVYLSYLTDQLAG